VRTVFSAEAESDLERIGDYIATDTPLRALSFVRELVARCERLSDMPRVYPLVPRYEHTDVRRLPHWNYLIFYRVDEGQVVILHILNGAQDYEALLFPGDES
jgi:plasmid stabilization system protein ParE